MKKSTLVDTIADSTKLQKKQIREVLNALTATIEEKLISGESVELCGLVKFTRGIRRSRRYKNIRTKEIGHSPEKYYPDVIVSQTLKKKIANLPMEEDAAKTTGIDQ